MRFGCVVTNDWSKVDFSLPADASITQALLRQLPHRTQKPTIYIGCAVWADRSFVGHVYPKGTPTPNFLSCYCQQFNTVELNATFYSIPSVAQVKKWKETATPGFKFCPKMPRSISHGNHIDKQCRLLDTFLEAILHFEEALGMTFLQLPPYYSPSGMQRLQQLLTQLPKGFSCAVEFRHPAWFSDQIAQQEVFTWLQQRELVAVLTDVAGRRDVLHQALTADCAFIRFVGHNLRATDYTRIDAWIDRLQQWLTQGLSKVYFLLHEPKKALCADLAIYMIKKLNKQLALQLVPPVLIRQPITLF